MTDYAEIIKRIRTNCHTYIAKSSPIMKKDSDDYMSALCYLHCRHTEDDPDIAKLITEPKWSLKYCLWKAKQKDK